MYLLDTNVVSELRRPRPNPLVTRWIAEVPSEQLFLSSVTVGEIQVGIENVRDRSPGKADELEAWLDAVVASYSVLPMDAAAFREWARLKHRKCRAALLEDAMIAATAVVHRLTVVTRNARDYRQLGVAFLNPFAG